MDYKGRVGNDNYISKYTAVRKKTNPQQNVVKKEEVPRKKSLLEVAAPVISIQAFLAKIPFIGEEAFLSIEKENFLTKENYTIILREAVYLSIIRPSFIKEVANFLLLFAMNITNYPNILDDILNYCLQFRAFQLLRILVLDYGLFTKSHISGFIKSTENGDCAIFFADQFPELLQFVGNWGYSECYRLTLKKIKQILKNENMKGQVTYLFNNGWEKDTIQYYIKNDDLNNLQKHINNLTEINKPLEWSPFEWYPKPTQCTMISYAALFGAEKCFDWFINKNTAITDSVCQSALIGGNSNIIYRINQKMRDFISNKNRTLILHKYHLFKYQESNKWSASISSLASHKCRSYQSILKSVNEGATIDSRDEKQFNSVHHYALAGLKDVVELLIPYSHDVKGKTILKKTLVHLAAESGNENLVDYLITEHGFLLTDKWGFDNQSTIAHSAALSGNIKMIKHLKDKYKVDIHSFDNSNCILMNVIMSGSISLLKYLIKHENYQLTYVSNTNITLLYYAVKMNKTQLVEYLIKHGIVPQNDPNYEEIQQSNNEISKYFPPTK